MNSAVLEKDIIEISVPSDVKIHNRGQQISFEMIHKDVAKDGTPTGAHWVTFLLCVELLVA